MSHSTARAAVEVDVPVGAGVGAEDSTGAADAAEAPTAPASGRRAPSAAQVAANRRNAARSTGPKTAEGKARSRANALKHGLAGQGVCLPSEDAATVHERCLLLHEELAPTTLRGMMLVEVIALAHTRIQRAARQEVATLTYKQRAAVAAFDDARLTEAEENLDRISSDPVTRHRRLRATPEGVDLLIARLGDVRAEVRNPNIRWSYIHGHCLEHLCGRRGEDRVVSSRGWALSLALEFDSSQLTEDDKRAIAHDHAGQIKEWAKPQMEAHIDAEIERLQAHRATLDHAALAQERAEAPERAMFDAGRDAALARRYEAASLRTLFRALREYRTVEAEAEAEAGPDGRRASAPHFDETAPSALDEPTRGVAEVLEEGDAVVIVDPADRAAEPAPPPRPRERPELASFGITVSEASRVLSQPHADTPPVPFHLPVPPVLGMSGRPR